MKCDEGGTTDCLSYSRHQSIKMNDNGSRVTIFLKEGKDKYWWDNGWCAIIVFSTVYFE